MTARPLPLAVAFLLPALALPAVGQPGDLPKGDVTKHTFAASKVFPGTTRPYSVYVPKQYDGKTPACVYVNQDGIQYNAPAVFDQLIAEKAMPVTIGVFVAPGVVPPTSPDALPRFNRSFEYDGLGDAYARFLLDELLPEVEKLKTADGRPVRLSKSGNDRAIGGASSGAICAFTAAWERPDQFRNVVSLIGSFTDIHGGHVYPELVTKAEKKPLRVFLQDGELDNRSPQNPNRDWYLQNQKMIAALKARGYDHAAVIGKGGHSDDHGGAILPVMLRWVWRDHPDVVKPAEDLVAAAAAVKPEPVVAFPGFDPKAAADPTGTYTWETRARNTALTYTLTVKQAGGKVEGALETKRGDAAAVSTPIADAVMQGNKLLFAATTRVRDQDVTTTYQAVVSDKGLTGWQLTDAGGQPRDTAWSAKRAAVK